MPAFIATVEGEEGRVGGVYFVKHAINARREVCDYWQDGELGGAEVRRTPHLDKYEEQGWVPITDMIYEGWWAECHECGIRLTDDYQYDENDNEFTLDPENFVGVFNGACFCSQKCSDEYHHYRAAEKLARGQILNTLQANLESRFGPQGIEYPEDVEEPYSRGFHCTVRRTKDGEPFVSQAQLNFKVPGCKYGLYYRLEDPEGTGEPDLDLSYNPHDHEAVAAFFLERTGRVLDKPEAA